MTDYTGTVYVSNNCAVLVRLGTGGTHYRAETNDEEMYAQLRAEGLDWTAEFEMAQRALDDFAARHNLDVYNPKSCPWKSGRPR